MSDDKPILYDKQTKMATVALATNNLLNFCKERGLLARLPNPDEMQEIIEVNYTTLTTAQPEEVRSYIQFCLEQESQRMTVQ